MTKSAHPQWTAKMYAGSVGRDHLGLGSVSSDQILPTLSPAINVLTDHPRYHSFYTFLLDEFWRRDRPRSHAEWVRFFRPREFMLSLGSHLCDRPEHGNMPSAVGSQKTLGQARRELPTYDTSFNYIKSDLGGYGLYYRSVMAELGVIYPGGRGYPLPVDAPSERGQELAAAFRSEVKDTVYYRDFFDHDDAEVPIEVIREYTRTACLCQLRRTDSADHPLLSDTFLHGGDEQGSASRRATFRLLLDLAAQTTGHGLNESRFRQLIYFGADRRGATFEASPALEGVARRWRLYQAREYYSLALNGLWCHLCDWGIANGGAARPLPVDDFEQHLQKSLSFAPLAAELGLGDPGLDGVSKWTDLTRWLKAAIAAEQGDFDAACRIDSPVNEDRLHSLVRAQRSSGVAVTAALTLLATLAERFDSEAERFRPEWEISRMGSDGRLSVDGFLRALRRQQATGATIRNVTDWLYRDYVLLQHELVALSKLPDNTFRFRRDGNRLRFNQFPNPLEFGNSRFDALTTTLSELGLCGDVREAQHPLTPEGKQLLANGDLG
jgi:hypothetical protein